MALYAYEEGLLIYAAEACVSKNYRCSYCQGAVKVRKGRLRVPHFYHQAKTPSCRLYSKSEDHLLAQLSLQQLLPKGETILEKPFREISRVADLIWERPKIVFEIQCSLISASEIKQRMIDYATVGYRVVWILDDRIFNRRSCSLAEQLMRINLSYFATLRKTTSLTFYDQFEIIGQNKRIKKGRKLLVQLTRPYPLPTGDWAEKEFPRQILKKIAATSLFFHGDLIHKALLSKTSSELAFSMASLRVMEEFFMRSAQKKQNFFAKVWLKWFLEPFGLLILKLHERADS